jgi:hypothetical protein
MEQAQLGPRTEYSFPITQTQLADAMGMTAVHMNRTIRVLRRASLAEFGNRTVRILDWERLVELCEFDPQYLLIEQLSEQQVTAKKSESV